MQRARGKIAGMHRHDDAMPMVRMAEDLGLPFVRSSTQPQRSSARTARRGVTAGSRDVTRRP